MEPQDERLIAGLEVATNGVANGLSQRVDRVGFCKDRDAERAGGEPALRSLFDQKDQLVHDAILPRGQLDATGVQRRSV